MSKQVQVSIKHPGGAMSNATVDVNHGPSGRPVVIKGQPGSSYQLKDMLTGTAPDQVLVKRKGNNLHIRLLDERDAAVGAEASPDIVIENFYDDPNASLTGQAENGSFYNYLPQEGDAAHLIEHLADGASSYQSLGYSQAAPVAAVAGAAGLSPWLLAPLAGLALAGGSSHHTAGQTIAPIPAPLPAPDAVAPSRPTLIATDDVAPVVGTVANGATTNDNVPVLSGAAEPGATVKLSIDGGAPVTVVADGAGNWSYTPPTALADGRHTVSITATDAAGNVSPAATLGFTVDTGIPAAPTLVGTDDRGATQGAIVHGSTIDDSIPALSGTAEPGAKLTLVIDGTNPIEVIADGSGNWRYTPPALADGLHNVTVTQTDAAGNVSPPVTLAFTIDTGVPALPTVAAADDVPPVTGPVANGSTTNDNLPVLSGTAEAGATVALTIAGPTPSTVTLTAAADGSWSYAPSMLTDGAYSISVTQSDAAGNVSPAATLAFTVDTSVPTATSSIAAISTDSGASSSDFVTSDNTLAIAGTHTALGAGETVQLSLDGGATWVAVTPMTATSWSYNNTGTVLADGTYNFQTRVVDAAGNVGTVSSRAVVIDTAAPTATSSITAVTTDSATAGDFVTNDSTLLVSGTSTALGSGEVVQVSLDGGLTWVATTPVTATSWSFDNTGAVLADGPYSFQTRVIDTAGLTGPVASQAVRIDTGVPTAPGLTATDDQAPVIGAIANGATTNDNQPALGGAAEPGATITITIDGTPVTVTADAAGNWRYTPAALADGVHSVSVTQTDAAGNVSPATALSFTTDTTVPAAPTLAATDDVAPVIGAIANGSTTNDSVPVLSGAAEPNATVTLAIDGTPVTVTADGAGVWSYTPAALADGVHSVSVTQTDAAGNVSPAATLGFTVDTAVPAAPTLIGTDDVAAMTGAIANGSTTNDNVPVLSGTAEPNATVTLAIDGTPVTVTADGAGNWSYTPPVLADGAHSVSVTQTDVAGNVSPAAVLSFTVDATAPATPVFTGTDDVSPVTGTIANGSTINDMRPAISGTTAEPNATVTVSISGPSDVTATVVADGAGAWSFTPGTDLLDGSYSVTVTQTDAAGNTSPAGAPLTFALDSAAPLSISAITAITNDSGISSSDFVTNDPTLVIGGSNSPLAAGEVVQVSLDGGTTWASTTPVSATSWSFDNSTSTLADGTYSFQTRVIDAAGNVGTLSSQAVTVDTTVPSASSTITAISTDSGTAGDFVTSDNTLAIGGANTALGSGEAVQLSLDGGVTWVAVTPMTATSWSYNNTGAVMADGTYNLQTRVIDAAGNVGTMSSQAVTVDTAAPGATSVITAITADSGTAGDFVTNDTDGLTVTGTNTALAAGEVVQISLDGGATWSATTSVTATSWTHATVALGNGSYSFQTRVIDAGGLTGSVASQAVVIDAGVPAAPGLTASDDVAPVTVSITAGSTTNDAQPTLSGTAEPNATVTLTIDGTPVTVTADAAGNWSLTAAALADGVHNVSVTQTDAAGNVSSAATLGFTVDTGVPAAPTLVGTDDVAPVIGAIANGSMTNDSVPVLAGTAEPNATVTLTIDGGAPVTVAANGAGNWSHTPTALADGVHSVSVTQTDAAGNVSPAVALGFTVDTAVPAAPTLIGTDDVAAMTGAIANGATTNDNVPVLSGTAEPNATLTLTIDGTPVTVTADGAGNWSHTPAALADGLHSVSVAQTDAAGNVSPAATLGFTVDATAPTALAFTGTDDVSPVTGSIANGSTINDRRPEISGTSAEPNATVSITISGPTDVTVTVVANGAGAWSFTPGTDLLDGGYSVSVTQTDAAGNTSLAGAPLTFTLDSAAPLSISTITAITTDSGASSSDFVTSDNTLIVGGTNSPLAAGEVVQVSLDGGTTWTSTTPVTATSWSFDNSAATLPDGNYSFQTRVIDAAGNTGAVSSQAVVIDTTAPAATSSITAISADSGTAGDFVTSDNTLAIAGANTALGAGETVQLSLDGGATWVAVTPMTATSWSYNNTGTVMADGSYSFQTRVIDAAGNPGTVSSQAVVIDTAVPSATSVITAISTDSGTAGDFVTSDNTVAITGTNTALVAGEIVQISLDGGATWVGTTLLTGTSWTHASSALADGAYSFQTRVIDTGGLAGAVSSQAVRIDTGVPAAPGLTAVDDQAPVIGSIANGSTTNDNVPALSGAAEPNATVTLTIDGTPVTVTADAAGNWSHTPTALADGPHSVSVTQTDAAGNVSPAATLAFTVDTTAPAAPTLTATDDVAPVSGAIANGSTTNDSVPVLSGTAEPNATVTVTIDGGAPVTVTANAAGAWSFTPAALADGAHSVSVTQTDAAGNASPAAALGFTVDTGVPAAPTLIGTDDVAATTGAIANGSTTNDNVPVLSGTAEPNATMNLAIDGGAPVTVTANAAGAWSFTPAVLADGAHSVTVTQTDAAGNVSPAAALSFTVDATAPTAPAFTGTDDVAPVTGTIANGSTINDVRPAISGTSAEPNATVTIAISGPSDVTATVVADGAGAWSFTPGTDLLDGGYSVSVTQTDAAGNTSLAGALLTFTLDSAAPLSISTITAVTTDSGAGGDFVTSDPTLAISGSNSPLAAGEAVQVSLNGGATWVATTPATATSWTYNNTGTTLPDGNYSFQTRVIDAAGNTGAASSQAVVIDTTAPAATSSITAISADSGTAGDFVTSDNTLAINGANTALGAGETVQLSLDGGATWVSTVPVTATSWSYNNTGAVLADGTYNFRTRVIDAAGNVGTMSSQAVTVDTAAPSATSVITAITTDSGTAGDFITNDTNGLTVTGANTALAAGEVVQISLDGGATWVATTPVTGTSWTHATAALGNGSYSFQTRVIDAASLTGPVASQAVVIDAGVPMAPTLIGTDDVAPVIGAIANGSTTNDSQPTLGGTAEPGATVTLTIDGTPVTVTADAAGNWNYTPAVLANGAHSVSVTQTDAAGNTSPATALAFTVDTAAPAAPTLTAADDVAPLIGAIANGSTTNDNVPVLSGVAEPNATVTLTIDGGALVTVAANGAGNWSHTPTALADGVHSVSVTQTDAAGNVSPAAALGFTVDTAVPAAPTLIGTDDVAVMTGAIANGATTNDNVPVLSGTAQPGATVTLTIDGTPVSIAADGAGNWSHTPAALTDGLHNVSATQTDAAGNVSPAVVLSFTVDATVPTAPAFTGTDDVAPVIGTIANGSTINDVRPAISGATAEPNATVTVSISGPSDVTATVVADGAGAWSFTPGADLLDGSYSVTVTQTDAAGNTSLAGAPLTFTLDSAAPLSISTITAITNDSGISSSDFVTNDPTLVIGGTNSPLAAGEVVQVSLDGGATWTSTTLVTATSWSFDNSAATLADGAYSFQTRVIDAAGNTGAVSSQAVVIDATAPVAVPAIAAITADSGTAGDFVTSDNTLAISGTNPALAAGETVQLSLNGGTTWVAVTQLSASTWSYNNTGAVLVDGSYSFQTRVIDAAGNPGPTSSQAVVIDTTAPVATSTITAITADTGGSSSDFVTNDTDGLTVTGANTALAAGEVVQISLDGGATWVATTPVTGTSWTHATAALGNGSYSFQTRVIDAASLTGPVATQTVVIDTGVPAAPTLVGMDDVAAVTGAIANGSITNDNVPALSGTAEPNSTVTLTIDGGAPITAVANAAGAWSHTPAALVDGLHSVSATQTDAAGNVSPAAVLSFTVDATAPATPAFTGTDDVAPVTGTIVAGSTINDVRPAISGTTAEPNATVSITFAGPTPVTATVVADGAGVWSFTPGTDLLDGSYSVSIAQTDAAGNTSPAGAPLTFTLDSAAPLSISTITAVTTDSGAGSDFVTSDPTLAISGTNSPLAAGEAVQISLDGGATWQSVTQLASTNWSFDNTGATLADGAYSFQTRVIDGAGNTGMVSSQAVTIDTAGSASTSSITAITTDSGTSPSDYITNDSTLAISGANSPLAAGEAVQISLNGGATWQAVTQLTGTSWSFDNTANTLSSGSHSFQTRVIDAAGNPGAVASQTVQIDTTPPTATIAIGAITADNGIAGDFQTNDPSLVVSGTVGSVLGAGEKVQISLDNGASWLDASGQPGAGTTWSHDATATTLPDGSYTFRARVVDIAGNTNLPASQAVVIDTSPSATVSSITAITDDNGAAGDFKTNDQSLVVSGTISSALLIGEKVQISLDGGTSWLDASGQPVGAGTSWSHDAQATTLGTPGSETSYTFQTRVVDAYGTPGAATSQAVVIDLAPPTATTDITAITNDSGIVGDYITSDRTLIIDGSNTALAAGEKVQLSLDGGGTWADVTMLSATSWSYNNTANPLPDGSQTFQTRVMDAAGNTGPVDSQAVQIIMDPPVVATNITAISSDSGVAGDWITSDTTLTVSGTNGVLNANPAWGEKVQLSFDNGATWVDVVQDAGGTWHYDNPAPLGATTHTLQSRVINAASLTGAVDTQMVTIDTSAPAVPVPTDVVTDTGGSTSDEITFDTTPTILGTSEANATINVYRDGVLVGTTTANGSGDWSYTEAVALAGGPASTGVLYNYTGTATDAAGNVSGLSANFSVRVDTVIAAPVIAAMGIDSGVSSTDHNTSDTTPTLTGTAEPGAIVQIFRDAVSQGSVTADGSGNWTYTSPALGGGSATNSSGVPYVFTATQTDVAGNASPATPNFVVTVDAITPVGTMTLDLLSVSDSGGLGGSAGDNITNVVTPTMQVALGGLSTADVNSINAGQILMTLWDDSNGNDVVDATETVHVRSVAFTATGGGGTGTASVTTTLPSMYDGAHPVKVQTVDLAGNVKTSTLDGTGQSLTVQHGGTTASASMASSLQPSDGLGFAMDSAGDFNGDGYEDMIVTAPHDQFGATAPLSGDFYVLFGTQNGLPTTANIDTLTSAQALHITNAGAAPGDSNIQGLTAAGIGDINGDGFSDVLLASSINDRAYVIFGRGAATPSFSLSTMNAGSTADGFWIDNNGTGGWLASDGGGGHDYNNDGYADLLLASADGNSSESTPAGSGGGGMYYILYGHAGSGAAAWVNLDARPAGLFDDALNTQLASGTHTTVGSSLATANHMGGKIQDVGDVNADGIHDYVVTDPFMDIGGAQRGSAFLVFGQQGSIGNDFNLANLTPAQGIRLDGAMDFENLGGLSFNYGNNGSADAWFSGEGRTLGAVGDINGDGIDDFAVGSPEWGDAAQDGFAPGRVYVIYGKSSGWSSGAIATQASGSTGFTLTSSAATDQLLGYTMAGAGDVNGDGIDDFLVGAATGDAAAVDAGQVYLVYGQAGGGFASGNLETMVGAGNAVQINGAAAGDFLGTGIAVGDWNGDGIADYATGAWEGGAADSGQLYSFIGSASKLTQTYTTGNDTLAAGGTSIGAPAIVNGVDRISGGQGNDTITGIGTDTTGTAATSTLHDVAYGGMDDDVVSLNGLVFTRVAGGTGTDTLALAGSGMNLDLAAYGNRVQGFEKFDLSSGGNTLHLRLSDVLNEPESTAEPGHLEVKGGALSTVDLVDAGGTWSDVGDQTVGGVTYDVWRHSAMTNTLGDVWIQQGITVL